MQQNKGKKQQPLQVPVETAPANSESIFDTSSESSDSENETDAGEIQTESIERVRRSRRWKDAELLVPPNIVYRKLRLGRYANKVSKGVLEYLIGEILDISVECATLDQKRRITPRHLMMAIRRDEEFSELLKNATLPGAGVVPHIEESLLVAPRRANRKRSLENQAGTSGVVSKKKKRLGPLVDSDDSD